MLISESMISKAILEYQQGFPIPKKIMDEIYQRIYFFPEKRLRWPREKNSEFFLFAEKKLIQLFNNYQDKGFSFGTYLSSCLFWISKDLRSQNFDLEKVENLLQEEAVYEGSQEQEDELFVWLADLIETQKKQHKIVSGKKTQIECFAAKYIYFLEEEHLKVLGSVTSLPYSFWLKFQHRCPFYLAGRLEQMRINQERRTKAYLYLKRAQVQSLESLNYGKQRNQIKKIQRYKVFIQKLTGKIRRNLPVLTNKEVAQILSIPKGTVDSAVYTLKKKPQQLFVMP